MKKNVKSKSHRWIIIYTIPFVGYLAAFLFESSYLSYFGVPSNFNLIQLTIENIIIAIITIASGLLFVLMLIEMLLPLFNIFCKEKDDIVGKTINVSLLQIGILSIICIPFLNSSLFKKILIFLGLVIFTIYSNFISPLIFPDKKCKTYKEKLKDDNSYRLNKPSVFDIVLNYDRNIALILMVIIIFLILSSRAGNYTASTQKIFLTTSYDNESYLVIKRYNQNFILINYDKNSKQITNKVKIITNQTAIDLKNEEVGLVKK